MAASHGKKFEVIILIRNTWKIYEYTRALNEQYITACAQFNFFVYEFKFDFTERFKLSQITMIQFSHVISDACFQPEQTHQYPIEPGTGYLCFALYSRLRINDKCSLSKCHQNSIYRTQFACFVSVLAKHDW